MCGVLSFKKNFFFLSFVVGGCFIVVFGCFLLLIHSCTDVCSFGAVFVMVVATVVFHYLIRFSSIMVILAIFCAVVVDSDTMFEDLKRAISSDGTVTLFLLLFPFSLEF